MHSHCHCSKHEVDPLGRTSALEFFEVCFQHVDVNDPAGSPRRMLTLNRTIALYRRGRG
jgi:hypothetical protein